MVFVLYTKARKVILHLLQCLCVLLFKELAPVQRGTDLAGFTERSVLCKFLAHGFVLFDKLVVPAKDRQHLLLVWQLFIPKIVHILLVLV